MLLHQLQRMMLWTMLRLQAHQQRQQQQSRACRQLPWQQLTLVLWQPQKPMMLWTMLRLAAVT
jgi:hypothetical protein